MGRSQDFGEACGCLARAATLVLQLGKSLLELRGHVVEGAGNLCELAAGVNLDALLQLPLRERVRSVSQALQRGDQRPAREGDRDRQADQRHNERRRFEPEERRHDRQERSEPKGGDELPLETSDHRRLSDPITSMTVSHRQLRCRHFPGKPELQRIAGA